MAAPTPSTRLTPAGTRLGDGYKTLVTIASDTNIEFWEVEVTPPALEGGDPVVTPTMHNTRWVTKAPRRLIDMGEMSIAVSYDPVIYDSILDIINVATTITVTFPDHSTLAFYGYVRSFTPDALTDGSEPRATVVIVPTNADPSTCAEEAPVYTAGAGTGAC